MSSYREELCGKDEKGVPLFSPFCAPGRTVDENLRSQVFTRDTSNAKSGQNNEKCESCYIPQVHYPKQNTNQMSEADSARDWFKDPTYAQHIAMRLSGVQENGNNPSLELYNKLKTVEKVTASLLQTL